MTRTPDDVKKGLECCAASYADCHKECPYKLDCDGSQILKDALTLIQQLEVQNAELLEKVEQLQAERDAAVHDMTEIVQSSGDSFCEYCRNWRRNTCPPYCRSRSEGFKWRGVQKEE